MTEQKNKTLKQWQKLFPDAMRIKATGGAFLSNVQLVAITFGAKVLQDTSWGQWNSVKEPTVYTNAIVSKMAGINQGKNVQECDATTAK